ncbi:LysM peptidoglycan-binding domain-containing protein [Anaerovibrio sp.]|uniref:LysM peptidoglycan-binding domain-containing protein n=1 Tax=Anaerovibrio sp. TaxID=1872532 RepID=UPI003F1505EB
MKKLLATLLITLAFLAPMHLDNEYLRADTFAAVTVQQGENLHDLAGRYTVNEKDKAQLIEAICEINGLQADAVLQSGRRIQVPVLSPADSNAIAQK